MSGPEVTAALRGEENALTLDNLEENGSYFYLRVSLIPVNGFHHDLSGGGPDGLRFWTSTGTGAQRRVYGLQMTRG